LQYSAIIADSANAEILSVLKSGNLTIERSVSDDTTVVYSNLEKTLRGTINENESYIDFSNQSLLCVLMGYEKPVFVNQSPGLLSDETSQRYFIEDIHAKRDRLPCAIFANQDFTLSVSLDNLLLTYRYYLVAEYIYTHYSPLLAADSFVIWYRNDLLPDVTNRIEGRSDLVSCCSRIDQTYFQSPVLHEYDLGDLARLWGMYDIYRAWNNEVCQTIVFDAGGAASINTDAIDKTSGNYLELTISAAKDCSASVTLTGISPEASGATFKFNIARGDHTRYMIRVSSDFNWYFADIDTVVFDSTETVSIDAARVLKGDGHADAP